MGVCPFELRLTSIPINFLQVVDVHRDHCFILARDKNKKDHKKLRRKIVDHCQKQCETGPSQAANLEAQKQTKCIKMHQLQVNMCFLIGPLR